DRVAILARGRCVAVGNVDDVLSRGRTNALLVRIDDAISAQHVLHNAGVAARQVDPETLRVEIAPNRGSFVVEVLARQGLYPRELRPDEVDLESVFLQLTTDPQEVAA
ncbi:MAG: ABC transporter ATP-binding protein, partial [Actinobacteria bacterium]|nr:ABC transporter ATP-binding protein [Actinomycetota bacterium]